MKMPSFEDMKKRYPSGFAGTLGQQIKEMSNMVFDETFSNNTTYRKGMIYDKNMNELEEMEFKFIKTKTFTVDKDLVEYWVQFKAGINPEIMFDKSEDQRHRMGYYIDVWDDNSKEIKKWLIVSKDQSEFDRYLVLECNWLFEWLDHDRVYHKCLGCLRNQNSYNSGIWASDFSTQVEDQMKFIVPANDETKTIDYNIRFMLSDNDLIPKTYEISKVLDTFPIGTIQCTLAQTLYNKHTDFCGRDFSYFGDNNIHRVCDFTQSIIQPDKDVSTGEVPQFTKWKLSGSNEELYVYGYPQVITATPEKETTSVPKWKIFIDNEDVIYKLDSDYTGSETDTFIDNYLKYKSGEAESYYLQDYFNISIDDDKHTFTIAAINNDMVNYIIKIVIYDEKTNKVYDFVEMEVVA